MSGICTVVTPTWKRPETILKYMIPSVECQTYSPVEHIVVIDGYDPDMIRLLQDNGYGFDHPRRRLTYLGRNWTRFSGDGGLGLTARLCGAWMAAGDYIAYLDDDIEWMPHHLESLIGLIEAHDCDFVTTCWQYGPGYGGQSGKGGWGPPGEGRTDTSAILCRAATLAKGGSWHLDGMNGEGLLCQRWIDAGCTWAHHDEATYIVPRKRDGAPD